MQVIGAQGIVDCISSIQLNPGLGHSFCGCSPGAPSSAGRSMTRPIAGRGGASGGGSGLRVFRLFLAGSVLQLRCQFMSAAPLATQDGTVTAKPRPKRVFRLPVVSQQRLCADNVLSGGLSVRGGA